MMFLKGTKMKTEREMIDYIAKRLITVEAEMRQLQELRRQDMKDGEDVSVLNKSLNCLNCKRAELKRMHEFIIFG